jgi:hypothetical protein
MSLLLQENLTLKRRLFPHPALQAFQNNPDLPSMTLECSVCMDLWIVPTNSTGEPDCVGFGTGILSCPVCGTTSQLIPIITPHE